MLSLSGIPFVVLPVNVDETSFPNEEPAFCVRRLSETKARAAVKLAESMGFPKNQLVLASDTIVVSGGMILGKPRDGQNALEMLTHLRGKIHQVLTAISLAWVKGGEVTTDLCCTDVPMRDYSDDEMTGYIATGDPLDKAGAYAIQHAGFHPVERMAGCYASVMGLPLCHLVKRLAQFGFKIEEDIPAACQHYLEYDCPVYQTILGDYGST